jgi:mxaJ protein
MRLGSAACALALALGAVSAAAARTLVVCSDPNNMPFSNRAGEGFENKIAAVIAKDMGVDMSYLWWPQRRGYVRKTLNEDKCDIWPGIVAGIGPAATTKPYYRSTYVFVSRGNSHLEHLSLDDARLKTCAIGVQLIGNDAMNTPPAHAIASRELIQNVHGYMIYRGDDDPYSTAAIVDAVASGDIDVAMVWGPLAGYFADHSRVPLHTQPITPSSDPRWPMTFEIAMGVRQGDAALLDRINGILTRDKPVIDAILGEYHVPLVLD